MLTKKKAGIIFLGSWILTVFLASVLLVFVSNPETDWRIVLLVVLFFFPFNPLFWLFAVYYYVAVEIVKARRSDLD